MYLILYVIDLDDEDCEKKLSECITQMAEIQAQFYHVKEQ